MKRLNWLRCTLIALIGFFVLLQAGCQKSETPAPTAPAEETPAAPAAKAPSKTDPGEMVLVPAGEFILGYDKEAASAPEQKMFLPAYYIDKYEVTMAQYMKFVVESGYMAQGKWRELWAPEKADFPVTLITWKDAVEYAKWAGKRLPTEFEWEKAARGEKGFRYPWGNEWEAGRANTYEAGLRDLAAVGSYQGDVSPYGAMDMLGNAIEWTASNYQGYKGTKAKAKEFGDNFRVLRGCDYVHYGGPRQGAQFHLAYRAYYLPDAHFNFSFRCAKDAPAAGAK